MELIKQEDLTLITSSAGKEVDNATFDQLKIVYGKLKHICNLLEEKGFVTEIRQDPRKQAGPGKFVFQNYHWARVYPKKYYSAAKDKFAFIVGLSDSLHFHLMGIKDFQETEPSLNASKKCWTEVEFEGVTYEEIIKQFVEFHERNLELFVNTGAKLGIPFFVSETKTLKMKRVDKVLRYKKQIILQGPPGTGKTKLAKELAEELVRITPAMINTFLKVGDKINNASGAAEYYTVKEIGDQTLSLGSNRATQDWKPTYKEIIAKYYRLKAGEKVENTNGLNPYDLAVARHLINHPEFSDTSGNVKIIQFHPNYTYEDFVRGIVVKTNGDKLEYVAEDKILGKMAKDALDNYRDSQKDAKMLSYEKWVEEQFPGFVKSINEQLKDGLVKLTDKVDVVGVDDDEAFRYKGRKGWTKKGNRMLFDDLLQAIADQNATRQDLKKNANLSGLARWHASYYIRMVGLFHKYVNDNKLTYTETPQQTIPLQNYVLIIDEINRANLSAVLGELIYALEYRGKEVESMYGIDDSQELILPPNLYIIGTMNTADRSAGTMDYAIRRRFAFVHVPARNLLEEGEKDFASDLFLKVSALFDTNISPEFDKVDVQLGHSYFIDKSTDEEHPIGMDIRWKYEIQPILLEYVKDGILIGEVEGTPIKQYIQEWEV